DDEVGVTLKYEQLLDPGRDGLDYLDARRTGADHPDALAFELHGMMWPARRMVTLALKVVTPLHSRQDVGAEQTQRSDQEAGTQPVAILEFHLPPIAALDEAG